MLPGIATLILGCILLIDKASAGGLAPQKPQNLLVYAAIDQCEGKDSNNYTWIEQFTQDQLCSDQSTDFNPWVGDTLTACNANTRIVNQLKTLAVSIYPQGAYRQQEILYLATTGQGSLEGKYVYVKAIWLVDAYLKKCSSILGYSYVTTKALTLLIGDKLDLNIFLTPSGAYEAFKRQCTTICKGRGYIF